MAIITLHCSLNTKNDSHRTGKSWSKGKFPVTGMLRVDNNISATALLRSLYTHIKWAAGTYVGFALLLPLKSPTISRYKSVVGGNNLSKSNPLPFDLSV